MEDTTTNPCRICKSEITNGRGQYRTADGLACFSCLSKMTRSEKKAEEVASRRWTAQESERELRELKRQEYLDAQAAIVELLLPLSGSRRAVSTKILDKIKTALKKTQDPIDRALKVNSLLRAASPAIEQALRELQEKKQTSKGPDELEDPGEEPCEARDEAVDDPITATAEGDTSALGDDPNTVTAEGETDATGDDPIEAVDDPNTVTAEGGR